MIRVKDWMYRHASKKFRYSNGRYCRGRLARVCMCPRCYVAKVDRPAATAASNRFRELEWVARSPRFPRVSRQVEPIWNLITLGPRQNVIAKDLPAFLCHPSLSFAIRVCLPSSTTLFSCFSLRRFSAEDIDSVPKSISISKPAANPWDALTAAYQFRVVPPLLLNRSVFIIYLTHFVGKRFSEGEARSYRWSWFCTHIWSKLMKNWILIHRQVTICLLHIAQIVNIYYVQKFSISILIRRFQSLV